MKPSTHPTSKYRQYASILESPEEPLIANRRVFRDRFNLCLSVEAINNGAKDGGGLSTTELPGTGS